MSDWFTHRIDDMDDAERGYYRDPAARAKLRRIIEDNYTEDGGPPKVKLEDGEILTGLGADLVFGLRTIVLRLIAAHDADDEARPLNSGHTEK